MRKKKILFLPSNKNHVRLFFPLYLKLKSEYDVLFITQGSFKSEGAEVELNNSNIPFKNFESFKDQNPEFIFKSEQIDLVIIGNDIDVIPQWFINCSYFLHIPSILIQDGMLFDYAIQKKPFSKIPIMLQNTTKLIKLSLKLKLQKKYKKISYGQSHCTQIHAWSKNSQLYLQKKSIDPQKIVITGNPTFSADVLLYKSNSHKIKRILYCPTSLIETGILNKDSVIHLLQILCEVVSEFKGAFELIIKPHPIEKKSFYKNIIRNFSPKIQLTTENLDKLLRSSDCVITNLSTVSISAVSYSKPVLLYLPDLMKIVKPDSFPCPLIDNHVALYANDKKSLTDNLNKILNKNFSITEYNRNKIIEEFFGPLDSLAATRSVEHIKKILQ